jgi:corrinoid protein of di/trimethylamine methyltransferase
MRSFSAPNISAFFYQSFRESKGKPQMEDFLSQCEEAVLKGDKARAVDLASNASQTHLDLLDIVERGFSVGIRKAGVLWEEGEYFLPELAFSAEAMKAAMDTLQPLLLESSKQGHAKGGVIIGTVQGDIHDIGKTLVATMLAANGYTVTDLGADVAHTRFLEEAVSRKPFLLCMSALLTTTMAGQARVIELFKREGLRDRIIVMVGGAPTSMTWAKEIGADGYAENAITAVHMADSLLSV